MICAAKILIFSLLFAVFLPSLQQQDDDEIDGDCNIQTSTVLQGLKKCAMAESDDAIKINEKLLTDVKKIMSELLKQQNDDAKSHYDSLKMKLEKLEELQKGTCPSESKMNIISDKLEKMEESQKNTFNSLESKSKVTEGQMSLISGKLEKMKTTLELVKTQVEGNANAIKLIPDCVRWQQWARDFDKTNLISVHGNHFYFNKTQMTWYEARDWCTERGMQLASLKNSSQVEAVSKKLRNNEFVGPPFWLSASDIRQPAGQFRWIDGKPVDAATWNPGDPNSFTAGQETCVFLRTFYAKLRDYRCSDTRYFLCEVPAALFSCF